MGYSTFAKDSLTLTISENGTEWRSAYSIKKIDAFNNAAIEYVKAVADNYKIA